MQKAIKFVFCAIAFVGFCAGAHCQQSLRISTRQREPSPYEEGAYVITNRTESWKPSETALIVCDMWDKHWCDNSNARFGELAVALGQVVEAARAKGVKIVHAPSECMDYYKDHPGRKEAQKYNNPKIIEQVGLVDGQWPAQLLSEKNAVWPIDAADGGCESPECSFQGIVWKKENEAILIKESDIISDSGTEIGSYFKKKGIKNVILTGVATNMCVIGRPFGLRAMKALGMNVVLMRDMNDVMYNPKDAPYVDHYTGIDLMVEYIEKYVCPSIVSTDFTDKKLFRFADDKRKQQSATMVDAQPKTSAIEENEEVPALDNRTYCEGYTLNE